MGLHGTLTAEALLVSLNPTLLGRFAVSLELR